MHGVEIVRVGDEEQLEHAFLIRRRVFVEEQRVPAGAEFDASDAEAIHLLALVDRRPLGTSRLRFQDDGSGKIERVAVLAEARGHGIGGHLVRCALDLARARGAGVALLHAQVPARGFYERLGFQAFGGTFIEDGMPHVAMRQTLDRGHDAPVQAA